MNNSAFPNTICFRLTRECNIRCPFCQAPQKNERALDFGEVKLALEKLKTLGIVSVKFTGGEPYLRADIDDIIWYCNNLNMQAVVCTNGIKLDPRNIDTLCATSSKVKVSVHGNKEHHNSFTKSRCYDKIIANVNTLIRRSIPVSLHTIVNVQNLETMPCFIEQIAGIGIKKLSLIALINRGRIDSKIRGVPLETLRNHYFKWREQYANLLDLRMLDFSKDYYVLESDGGLWIQRENEQLDTLISKHILNEDCVAAV